MKKLLHPLLLCFILGCALQSSAAAQVKQTPEVIEAYQVCRRFEQLLAEDLDFSRAYEATFTKDTARRRAIAITEGEFGSQDFKGVSDDLLVEAFKQRMQIFYLTLVLIAMGDGVGDTDDVALGPLFPPELENLLKRRAPRDARLFPAYVSELKRDVAAFQQHFNSLVVRYPFLNKQIRGARESVFSSKLEPPNYKVEPIRGYYRSSVLRNDEEYYEIERYAVVKEQGRMRIIGIRFFTRLF